MAGPNQVEVKTIKTTDMLGQEIEFLAAKVAAGIENGRNLIIPDHWVFTKGHDEESIRMCLGSRKLPRFVYGPPETTGPILGTCRRCPDAWLLFPWQEGERGRPGWQDISQERMHAYSDSL